MKQYFTIITRAYIWIAIGVVLMAIGIYSYFANARYSIQFTGWVEITVDSPTIGDDAVAVINQWLEDGWYEDFSVLVGKKDNYASILVQTDLKSDEQVEWITTLMQDSLKAWGVIDGERNILELAIIGPSIGDYIKKSAIRALITGTILMAIYILFAFSGMRQLISPIMLGVITIFTMLFDMAIPAGAYGIMMGLDTLLQVDTVFIIALLTVMWYSVNDTIVIFDRVRENFAAKQTAVEDGRISAAEVYEMSLWQTMRRSIGTSVSTLLVVGAMYIFGTGVLQTFAFTLGMWVLAGTFSSIFLAAPLAYLASAKKIAKKKA